MPGDGGDRTEPATPRRKAEARERGQIARSADLTSALLLLGGLLCLRLYGPRATAGMMEYLKEQAACESAAEAARVDAWTTTASVSMAVLAGAGPIMAGLMLVAGLAALAQVGPLLTGHPLKPSLDKLNPVNGVKRLFNVRTVVQLLMNLMKLALVAFVGYRAVTGRMDDILAAIDTGGWRQMGLMTTLLLDVGLQMAAALLVIALLDLGWQRYKHERDLRMTKEEVKEELKRMEGDPIMRQRRRRMQFAAAIQQIRSAVPKADVVVTNPTELAIAIRYDAATMHAPKVVAKGQGYLAQKIREIAAMHRIPILERKPLAQALFKAVEVGQEVPEQFYQAIAEILAYVYELSGRRPAA